MDGTIGGRSTSGVASLPCLHAASSDRVMADGGPAQPWSTVAQCQTVGYGWEEVKCHSRLEGQHPACSTIKKNRVCVVTYPHSGEESFENFPSPIWVLT